MRASFRSTNENNFSAHRIQLSSIRRVKAPNFLKVKLNVEPSSRRRENFGLVGVQRNRDGPRLILSLIDCDRFRLAADSLPTIQRFRLVGFPRYTIAYRTVKTSSNLFHMVFRSWSLSIAFQIEDQSVIDTNLERCAYLKPIEQARTTNRYPLLFTTSTLNKKSINLDRTIDHLDITFERNLTTMYNTNHRWRDDIVKLC